MREIDVNIVRETVQKLLIEANYKLPEDMKKAINEAENHEDSPLTKNILNIIRQNYEKADKGIYPMCQDTGMAIVFIDIGQDVHLTGGFIKDAIYQGVKDAYAEGYLRKSIVKDPLQRENTKDNLPPIIHTRIVEGDNVEITVTPKGFGSENQSALKMLVPSDGRDGVIDFIVDGVIKTGGKGCAPCVIGVGIGGDFEYSAILAKRALLKSLDDYHPDPYYREMEEEIKNRINASQVGSMGLGGKITCLGVKIESYPTHIAGLPVAYNYCCHALRHKTAVI